MWEAAMEECPVAADNPVMEFLEANLDMVEVVAWVGRPVTVVAVEVEALMVIRLAMVVSLARVTLEVSLVRLLLAGHMATNPEAYQDTMAAWDIQGECVMCDIMDTRRLQEARVRHA